MSQLNNGKSSLPNYPRAPPLNKFDDNVMMERAAPPTYEESLKQNLPQTQVQGYQHPHYQAGMQPFVYTPPPAYASQTYSASGHVTTSYAIPNAHAAAPLYQQAYAMTPQQPQVLTLARGAEIRMNNGAITIPPPPPGYAPTPAQWAAMQGQQVLVKEQKKRSFFS